VNKPYRGSPEQLADTKACHQAFIELKALEFKAQIEAMGVTAANISEDAACIYWFRVNRELTKLEEWVNKPPRKSHRRES
jgi:hypothetical protein